MKEYVGAFASLAYVSQQTKFVHVPSTAWVSSIYTENMPIDMTHTPYDITYLITVINTPPKGYCLA